MDFFGQKFFFIDDYKLWDMTNLRENWKIEKNWKILFLKKTVKLLTSWVV